MTNAPLAEERTVEFRLHNANFPRISRLPCELLSAIFLFAVPSMPTDDRVVDALFTLSSVCFNWRDAAMHTPILWVDALKHFIENLDQIYYDKLTDSVISIMDLLATRAQGLPIHWNINVMDDLPDYSLLPLLHKHKHHLGELLIRADVLSAAQILTHVTQPMPLLEYLLLFSHPRGDNIRLSLPPDLFGQNAPNLKKLEAWNVELPSLDLIATTFSNIRLLNMRSDRHPVTDITISRVLKMLAAMPNLEEIILFSFHICADELSDQLSSLKAIPLKDLHSMGIGPVDCRLCISFIKSLSLPRLEYLYLYIELEKTNTNSDILRVLCHQLLKHHLRTPLFSHPFEYAHISFRETTVTVKVGSESKNGDPIELNIVAYFPHGADSVYYGHALKSICCSLPLDQVHTLVLLIGAGGDRLLPWEDDPDDAVIAIWSEACAGMKSIQVAKVENLIVGILSANSAALNSAILRIVGLKEN